MNITSVVKVNRSIDYVIPLLLIILVIAAFIRFWHLGVDPPGILVDEASYGYNAYALLVSGRDEWGEKFPLTLRAFGDYKPAGYIYLLAPLIKLFGLNSFSLRLPSAIFGIIAVICIFFISRFISWDSNLSIISAFLLAIAPWHIYMSRMAWEANMALTLFLLGVCLLLKSKDSYRNLIIASLFFSATFYLYTGYRILIPLLLSFFIFFFFQRELLSRKKLVILIMSLIIFIAPLLPETFYKGAGRRFEQVSILKQQGTVMFIDEQRSFCGMQNNHLLLYSCYLLWNKPMVVTRFFLQNYLSSFSADFLFFTGDRAAFINNPGNGALYYWLFPFFLIGLTEIIYHFSKREDYKLVIFWLLLAPIMPALAGSPHFVRSNMILIPVILVIALGLLNSIKKISAYFRISKTIIYLVFIGLSLVSLTATMVDYFFIYTKKAMVWDEYYEPLFKFLDYTDDKYETVYFQKLTNHPYIYQLFYQGIDPAYFNQNSVRNGYDVNSIGKYRYFDGDFANIYCQWDRGGKPKALLVTKESKLPPPPMFTVKSFNQVHTLLVVYDLEHMETFFNTSQEFDSPVCDTPLSQ